MILDPDFDPKPTHLFVPYVRGSNLCECGAWRTSLLHVEDPQEPQVRYAKDFNEMLNQMRLDGD